MSGIPPTGKPTVPPTSIPRTAIILRIKIEGFMEQGTVPYKNPMCVVYEQRVIEGSDDCECREIGRTEIAEATQNPYPAFNTPIQMEYIFEIEQRIKVDIHDIRDGNTALGPNTFIGSVEFPLFKVVSSPGGISREELVTTTTPAFHGTVLVSVEEVKNASDCVRISLAGRHLAKKDLFGKSDPYIKIIRVIYWEKYTVHRTEPIYQTLDPVWSDFTINVGELCGGNFDEKLIFECWDWDKASSDDFIGECSISLNEIQQNAGPFSLPLIDERMLQKKGYKNSGELVFNGCSRVDPFTFMDYLRGGCEFNLITAVDFTSSNGNPKYSGSLHYCGDSPNQYERAMRTVGNILLSYDHDKKVPLYGFGTGSFLKGQSRHCFALNGNPEDPEVCGVEGMIDTYRKAVGNFRLGDQTFCAPVIEQTIKIAEANLGTPGSRYFVLLILTDGAIADMSQTMSAITQAANNLPISIVIVGVGGGSFPSMVELDGDNNILYDSKRHAFAVRDIVQFVPFSEFENSPEALARETLAEIPSQVCSFMNSHNIVPNPNLMVPPQSGYPQPQPVPYQQ